MRTTASQEEVFQILNAEHHDPFHVLGSHLVRFEGKPAVAIRAFLPEAARAVVRVMDAEEIKPMERVRPDGFFEAVFDTREDIFPYRLRLTNAEGNTWEIADPYSFWP